jgi:hypothetical protein
MPNTITLHSPPAAPSPRCGEVYLRPGGDAYMVVYVGAYLLVSLKEGSYWNNNEVNCLADLDLTGFTRYSGSITIKVS